jgi:hypothetical protein
MATETYRHPAFIRAEALPEPLRSHFPKSPEEAADFVPMIRYRALSSRVLVVARTRVECAWAAYCDAVPGQNHRAELEPVLDYGAKVDEPLARLLFPQFDGVPYAE